MVLAKWNDLDGNIKLEKRDSIPEMLAYLFRIQQDLEIPLYNLILEQGEEVCFQYVVEEVLAAFSQINNMDLKWVYSNSTFIVNPRFLGEFYLTYPNNIKSVGFVN